MKKGDKFKDKYFGNGVIIEDDKEMYVVAFESGRVVKFPRMQNENLIAGLVWFVIFVVCFMSFIGFLI